MRIGSSEAVKVRKGHLRKIARVTGLELTGEVMSRVL